MNTRIVEALLAAYHKARPHIMPELPDHMEVLLLVRMRLDDLRALDVAHRVAEIRAIEEPPT